MGDPKTPAAASPEEIGLKQAYELLLAKVQERVANAASQAKGEEASGAAEAALKNLRDKVLKLKVIFIDLESEQDVYEVFETLNTRGKDLDAADLVKTHLLRALQAENQNLDTTKDSWDVIRRRIEGMQAARVDLDTFMHHQWLSTREYLPSRLLY